VETIFSRDQHIVDEWMHGEIEEAELRQRIRFDFDWDTIGRRFTNCYPRRVIMPSESTDSIACRVRICARSARAIGTLPTRCRDSRTPSRCARTGVIRRSHLAPRHLPAEIRERLPKARMLTALQNVDALYWRAAGEQSDHVQAVRVADDIVCVFNATPLEKYENYRLYLNRWGRDETGALDLGPTVYNLIDGLVRFLGINLYSPHNTPSRVYWWT